MNLLLSTQPFVARQLAGLRVCVCSFMFIRNIRHLCWLFVIQHAVSNFGEKNFSISLPWILLYLLHIQKSSFNSSQLLVRFALSPLYFSLSVHEAFNGIIHFIEIFSFSFCLQNEICDRQNGFNLPFLCGCLQLLQKPHNSARNKIISICVHIFRKMIFLRQMKDFLMIYSVPIDLRKQIESFFIASHTFVNTRKPQNKHFSWAQASTFPFIFNLMWWKCI